ncbi:hypothetical protein KPG71_18905 [Roseovarius sp. PS-C2]|uniref:hypothetical protein n=1 Tax=Roseovarius sp. PS-C2 TaxID=2820814 RepID=UPI001C0DB27B|nr:hypothetical protein [Roseovarius sp. PS-C2]MBU3262096.1 hypothetical protein [Roseovarius sp. PS-C2]
MTSTIIIHATAAVLVFLSLCSAAVFGLMVEKDARDRFGAWLLITTLLAVSAFILQVVA